MMKYISTASLAFCFFLLFPLTALAQIEPEDDCYYGILFEISDNPSWGYGELVITHVEPYSQAESLGMKRGDIIMEINGITTYLKGVRAVTAQLLDKDTQIVEFSIRNIDSQLRKIKLNKICTPHNSVSEKELARIFSFYSLESTSEREFHLPLRVETNNAVDYANYQTYDFAPSDDSGILEKQIIESIEKKLREKGMKRDTKNPDMVIQTFYSVKKNSQYNEVIEKETDDYEKHSWRFDSDTKSMLHMPAFDPNSGTKYANATDVLSFGISFYDRKLIDKTNLTQIWEGEIEDYMHNFKNSDMYQYLKTHIPLMLSQYPYVSNKKGVDFTVKFTNYNYTGLHFKTFDLSAIDDVDKASPAYLAGMRAGNDIIAIDADKFAYSNSDLSEGYKNFISESAKYRDPATRYLTKEGYTQAMHWNKEYYEQIKEMFGEYKYLCKFSYLYKFAPYVPSENGNAIKVIYWDENNRKEATINPTIRTSIEIDYR